MSVEVEYADGVLTVNGERVRKDWGFVRKGARKYRVVYRVVRWGRTDLTLLEHKTYRYNFAGYHTRQSRPRSETIMSHETFAQFLREFYGYSYSVGQAEEDRQAEALRREAAAARAVRDQAQEEIASLLESIQSALDSDKGLLAVVDLIDAARKDEREKVEQEEWDRNYS